MIKNPRQTAKFCLYDWEERKNYNTGKVLINRNVFPWINRLAIMDNFKMHMFPG